MVKNKINLKYGVVTSYDGSYGQIAFSSDVWTFVKRDVIGDKKIKVNDVVSFREEEYDIDGIKEKCAKFVKKME